MNDERNQKESDKASKLKASEASEVGGKIVAAKGDKNIEMSYLLSPKTSLGDKDLDRILGSNFSNVRDMIEAGKNEFLEIGEIYHEKSLSKGNYVVGVKSNKGHTLQFKIGDHVGKKVKDVKEFLFGKDMADSHQIRFIMNGRMLNDNDEILKLKVDNKSNIHAFISPRVGLLEETKEEKKEEVPEEDPEENKDAKFNVQDALNGQRGFDYFKINGYTDQEIIWKRYIFHSDYILTMPLSSINDDQLFLKEECFLLENQKFIKKPELFKFCEFKPELNEIILFKTKMARFGYFLLGVFLGIPYMLTLFNYNLREDKRLSLVIGTLCQAILLSVLVIPHLV